MAKKTLFITGATGFIGKVLLSKLDFKEYDHVYCLGRSVNDRIKSSFSEDNFTFIKGDLFQPQIYSRYLALSDTVIHLAAITGKAKRDDYFHVNLEGTKILLQKCKHFKIDRFVFISSIAAKFKNTKYYYYAQSKIEAEKSVILSGLPYLIIRPTIVIGRKSAVMESFTKLASFPLVPIFGPGTVKIQPIFVMDLANNILHIIKHNRFLDKTIELGGPEQITIEDFIKRIHQFEEKGTYRSIHLPISLFTTVLSLLEKFSIKILPFTAGQLATFSHNGTCSNYHIMDKDQVSLIIIDEMLSRSLEKKKSNQSTIEMLRHECRILTRYLINSDVNEYTELKYIQGHKSLRISNNKRLIDRVLIKKAIKNSFWVKLVDIYSSIFCPNAIIRKKLVLLIAILECQASSYGRLDFINEKSKLLLCIDLVQKAIVFIFMLIFSIIFFAPLHAVGNLGSRSLYNKL